jgi:CheY-like chemotaxis protein
MDTSSAEEGHDTPLSGLLDLQVLIADDEVDLVEELARGLRHRAFHVLTATSGAEAWAILQARKDIGVAVCDIRMPGMDGHALARCIAARNVEGPGTEIILISGHGSSQDEAIARQAGVFAFLRKPFLASELRVVLRRALARALARRQTAGKAVNA